MVKMSLEPVQVMSGQVAELKVAPSSNGDSGGSWEEKREFDKDHLGLTAKPKPVTGRRARKVEGAVFFVSMSRLKVGVQCFLKTISASPCLNLL